MVGRWALMEYTVPVGGPVLDGAVAKRICAQQNG